jgi:hypothetical protein
VKVFLVLFTMTLLATATDANFGVSLAILKDFLNEHRVPFSEAADAQKMATEDLMAEAVHYTVFILCGK